MTATTAVEQLVACGIMLLGIIFFGFVISTSQCAAPPRDAVSARLPSWCML